MNQENKDELTAITDSLRLLNGAVVGSKILRDVGMGIPYCTVDGKRQVMAVGDYPGYDLWVPKHKPTFGKIVEDYTCSDFGTSFEQAVAFLNGVPMNVIRSYGKYDGSSKVCKEIFQAVREFAKMKNSGVL